MADGLQAPAWPAEWLNGWMAALGIACRSELLLSFTATPVPKPMFHHPDGEPVELATVATVLPTVDELAGLSISRPATPELGELPRDPTPDQYRSRASYARQTGDPFLAATITDLAPGADKLAHSPFDAAVPKGLTLWERVVACRKVINDPGAALLASFNGTAPRVRLNGLGFDARRVTVASATDHEKYVDPAVEVFAFCSLPLFPIRGSGGKTAVTRGWQTAQSRRGAFSWPVWQQPLTAAAIDHLLDVVWNSRPAERTPSSVDDWGRRLTGHGVFGCYGSVAYQSAGRQDNTRAYSSEELWMRI
jgi:hypothetical protein